MKMENIKHIYFIGIGGIGMSALARYFHKKGIKVSGYDKTQTELTSSLEEEGMNIHYTDDVNLIPVEVDYVVITPAIPKEHKEWNYLIDKGIKIAKRSEVLGLISKNSHCLAVAGTHGKTTTTTLLAHLLKSSGIDCTAFLGGIAVNYNSNYIEGNSDIVVVEADEYDRSFLQLHPIGTIVTAMDADHLEIYGNSENMKNAYGEFVNQTCVGGKVVYKEGLNLQVSEKYASCSYGIEKGNCKAENIKVENGFFVFDYSGTKATIKNIRFSMPGRHNAENATAAISLALEFGATEEGIRKALSGFKGIKRRFEFIIREESKIMIDDYAHHPEELKAAINAARELYPQKKITGVFQPHLFSRTRDFANEFAQSLDLLDEVLLLDIYPARELPIEGITSQLLIDRMRSLKKKLVSKEELIKSVSTAQWEVVLVMGAGDIDRLLEPMKKEWLKNR